ncbi:MAG: type VI secretion system contractile sheath large subunit [Phycisphaerae bacterium]
MSQTPSAGPITSTPEIVRRPYHILFVGDLGVGDGIARPIDVDKDEFAPLLARLRPTRALAIPSPLGSGSDWEFKLTFDSLKAFEPSAIVALISDASWRVGLRKKVVERRAGRIPREEFDRALSSAAAADKTLAWVTQSSAAAGTSAAAPAGESVLDMVDDPSAGTRVSADVERLAAAAGDAEKRLSGNETQQLDALSNRLDAELGKIADAVLKHPEVRALESAWRGLKFLVDKIDFRSGAKLSVLSSPRDAAVARFAEQVVTPSFEGLAPTPGLVVFDYPFANTPVDMEFLDSLAQQAASLPAPVIVPVDAKFFNVKSLGLLKSLPNLVGLTDGFQFAKWKSLRDKPHSRWIAPVLGRFVLRAPHQIAGSEQVFAFQEAVAGEKDLLWGGGHLALTACAARAFANHGWPTRMFGAEAGKIADLPVIANPADPKGGWGPGDLLLPDERIDEVANIGMNLLLAYRGQDKCILMGGVTIARPVKSAERSERQAALEISLAYQQFSAAISAYLVDLLPSLRGVASEEIQKRLLYGLREAMTLKDDDPEDSVLIGIGAAPDDPTRTLVQARLTPPSRIVPGGLHVDFGFVV